MVLKTFNLDEEIYKKYSSYCKEHGISMSKQIDKFIRAELFRFEYNKNENKKNETKDISLTELKEKHPMNKYC